MVFNKAQERQPKDAATSVATAMTIAPNNALNTTVAREKDAQHDFEISGVIMYAATIWITT
jgi:phage terminase large subunit-like protein